MITDKRIRKEALRLHFIEDKDPAEICRIIKDSYGVIITINTVKTWARSDIGKLYRAVNCKDLSNNSIQTARDQEREIQKDILGDAVSTGK